MKTRQNRGMVYPALSSSGIDRLILAVGEEEFGPLLFDTVLQCVRSDMYASFSVSEPGALSLLFAGGCPGVPDGFPVEASQQYAQGFWKRDPLVRALMSDKAAQCTLRTQSSEMIPSGNYRSFCYDQPRVHDRLSIFRRSENVAVLLNFYRYRDSGRFSERDVYRVSALSGVVSALIVKHLAVMDALAASGRDTSVFALAERIRRQGVALSDRELSVCAAILSGAPMKAISRDLGIELSTAITYKRRAYDKLGVSTRFELRSLVARNREAIH
jgi:DNA-binding CsgD family transcriptional regulator